MKLPYEKTQQELKELLQAQYPLIFIRSSEETRAINCAISAYQSLITNTNVKEGELAKWSSVDGFLQRCQKAGGDVSWNSTNSRPKLDKNPQLELVTQALDFLQKRLDKEAAENLESQYTYLLPDMSALIEPNCHVAARKLKELVIGIDQARPRPRMTLIIIGTDWSIPTILRNHVHIVDLKLPIGQELYQDVFRIAENKYELDQENAKKLAEEAEGIPLQSAIQTARLTTARNLWTQPEEAGRLLLEIKKQEIRKTGVLEYYAPQGEGLKEVGGLENIKTWIANRYPWFERDDQPKLRPRAILLEGFPGCGKSFIAKAIAVEWRIPQINFEISRLQSKWVGESESNTYQAFRAIEASAPNILFMDEIEKAFAGVGGDSSGTTTRQFGTFLSWLNDHQYPIFFIATSNDRAKLPPELFRAGRFNETFIVMPPNTQERWEIIQKRAAFYQIPDIDSNILDLLVEKTRGFSGAELDKLIQEAIYLVGNVSEEPDENSWLQALQQIKPQYRTPRMQELLRTYLHLLDEGGGQPASSLEEGFLENLLLE